MKKLINFLREPLAFPIVALGASYIAWFLTAPMDIHLSDDNFSNLLAGLILLGIYVVIIVIAKAASKNWKLTLVFMITVSFVVFLSTLFVIAFVSELELFGWFKSKAFFIAVMLTSTIYPLYRLVWNRHGKFGWLYIILFIFMLPILGASIIYPMIFYPTILDQAVLGNITYYVASSPDWDGHYFHIFYRCTAWEPGCRHLYFTYSESIGQLLVDEKNKEVSLVGFSGLLYTDGHAPRRYASNGKGIQLGNHSYDLTVECNNLNDRKGYYECESNTYTLYECDLNLKSCHSLPAQFTDYDARDFLWLEANEITNSLNLYKDEFESSETILILTWGETPRCYIEGCKILEK